jgi:hypothetical protein
MPNFSRLAAEGSFAPLGTSVPPQSPVAWSNFITGHDPGAHGIFDFVHRDPATKTPYLSTSRTVPPARTVTRGPLPVPAGGRPVELLRHGQPFWETRGARRPTSIIRMPANFPPSGTAHRELSGMGTPDLAGTYGTFTFYSSELFAFGGRPLSGGRLSASTSATTSSAARCEGPTIRSCGSRRRSRRSSRRTSIPAAARQAGRRATKSACCVAGEWSDWVPVRFPMIPTQSLRGMVRFYLKQVRPEFELYASPSTSIRSIRRCRSRRPVVCGRAGQGDGTLLHAGHAGRHQGARGGGADARRVPRAGAAGGGRGAAPAGASRSTRSRAGCSSTMSATWTR